MLSGDSSPFFEVIFILLCVEGAITTLLVAPLPPSVRGYLVRWLSDSSALASLARPLAYFVAVLVLACLSSAKEVGPQPEQLASLCEAIEEVRPMAGSGQAPAAACPVPAGSGSA